MKSVFHKGIFRSSIKCIQNYSTAASTQPVEQQIFATAKRTKEDNPTNHKIDQIGLFYTISNEKKNKLFKFGGIPKSLTELQNIFNETSFMIRNPAVEIINYMKLADYNRPPIKYLIYGVNGAGKSCTMAHVIHYASINDFLILHVPWVWNWFRTEWIEVVFSPVYEGMVDLPLISSLWLKHFESQNSEHLKKLDIRIKTEYVWNQREKTESGSTILDLVKFGLNRVKYAGLVIEAIVQELKLAATNDQCKILVAVDGCNAMFGEETTNLKDPDKKRVIPERVTLTKTFLNIMQADWKNGAIVLTVDKLCGKHLTLQSHLPLYLLGKKGFKFIDPFIPIQIQNLNNLEFNSMLDYYEDRRWIHRKGSRGELSFLSNNNPYALMNLCSSL